jgi:hypothetical protein
MRTIGKITLKKQYRFTQYSECAAWTDYVTCEPQTVDLRIDDYWACAKFDGVLTVSTFPSGSRHVGQSAQAGVQTQKFGGIGDWLNSDLFSVEITDPSLCIKAMGVYSDGCGESSGKPILALQPVSA